MRYVLIGLFAVHCFAQIEVTQPGTGVLVSDVLLIGGKRLAAGMAKEPLLEALGAGAKGLGKPKQTSSLILIRELSQVIDLQYRSNAAEAGRRFWAGLPFQFNDSLEHVSTALTDMIVPKCGACWVQLVEKKLASREFLRAILIGPSGDSLTVAGFLLDKRGNAYSDIFDKPWSGVRDVYLVDKVKRLRQEPGVTAAEDLDLRTGHPDPPAAAPAAPSTRL